MENATRIKVEAIRQAQLKASKALAELARLAQEAAVDQVALAAALEEVDRVQRQMVTELEELPWS